MSLHKWILSTCILVCLSLTSGNRADDPQLLPRSGVLVLRTGRLLRGDILRVGDRYVVALTEHDEVSVPVESVEMWCDSLDDAYRQKRSQLPHGAKVSDHLQLADWCLRYDLMPAAAEQLMAAQRSDPFDPANAQFEKRLRLAACRPATTTSSNAITTPVMSPSELNALVRSLPAGTVEQFTNTIQPLLINRCGASNCHGPNSPSDFRLVYPNWSRTLPRRFTQQNLKMAFDLLDRDDPARSPLLRMATLAHGNAEKPAITEEDVTQLQNLAAWAYRSMSNTSLPPPSVLQAPDVLLMQPLDRRTAVSADSPSRRTGPSNGEKRDSTGSLFDPGVQRASHVEPISAVLPPIPPGGADPFDPEIFNRRYLKPVR